MNIGSFEIEIAAVVLGAISGVTYGLLAIGLILVYRSSKVINFAQGNIGSVGAAVMERLSLTFGLPWVLVFPVALAAGALSGLILDVGVMRRLRKAPKIISVVATLGAAQLLLGLAGSITHIRNTALFPPPFRLTLNIGGLVVTPYYAMILVLSPLIVAALALFLAPPRWLPARLRSRYGPAIRAAADNPEAARTAGISPTVMSAISWSIAGTLAAFSGALLGPARGFQTLDALGPELLVRALAPAVIAGMMKIPAALVTGVVIGIAEHVVIWNYPRGAVIELVLFALIAVGLLVRRSASEESDVDSSWLSIPLPRVREGFARRRGTWTAVGGFVVAALLPLFITNEAAAIFISMMALATIGLSVTLITGIAGQISLGQFALAGVGGLGAYLCLTRASLPWLPSLFIGALFAAAVSVLIGLPALRLRGLLLAITSVSFAVMAPASIFSAESAFGFGATLDRPIIAGRKFEQERLYYYVVLGVLAICFVLVHNLRRGGIGRGLQAIRDSEDGARAFGISTTLRKLQAFGVSGFIAGLGGIVYAQALARITPDTFSPDRSIAIVVMAVIGGIGHLSGALLGAAYLVGLPHVIPITAAQLLVSGAGVLVLVLYFPEGLSQILRPLLNRFRTVPVQEPDVPSEPHTVYVQRERTFVPVNKGYVPVDRPMLLRATDLTVTYGGVRALDGASIDVFEGETLGIIGPNGSGKTTLFKALSGFRRPEGGTVWFDGKDISGLPAQDRARIGLIRSFQDSKLFPTLTVRESVRLALEEEATTRLIPSALGLPSAAVLERRKAKRADDLVASMGLEAFADKLIGELSTGTRRIAEMCCLIALRPRLLLLDEPSSGIAQRETEALGELLARVKHLVGATLVVIEHDMPLIMGISDRIVAMESGRAIAQGTPAEVQEDETVIDSYLGASQLALARSGT